MKDKLIFKSKDKLADIINQNHLLLPILNRFEIHLGIENKTVEYLAKENNINIDFLLVILNAFHNKDYFPIDKIQHFPLILIVEYLKKTHQYYLTYIFPRLEKLLSMLIQSYRNDGKNIDIINSFYKKFKLELLNHIKDEEENIFPIILDLENNIQKKSDFEPINILKIHTNVDDEINDLKNLIIKYLKPNYDIHICNEFLSEIYRFHKDLKDHERIEDLVLFPKLKSLEKDFLNDK